MFSLNIYVTDVCIFRHDKDVSSSDAGLRELAAKIVADAIKSAVAVYIR